MASVVVVGDAQGHVLRRITLPHEPELLYGTTASQTVLIEGMDSWMVTNLASGKTVTLDFGATSPLDIHVLVQAGRWWVLGTDSGSTAYLLDVQSGKLQDLASVGIKQLASPTFAPGEGALLAYAPGPTLIRTGSPAVVRSVAQGEAASASFSPDGARVIYTLKSGSSWNVVSESMDGSESQTLLTSSVPLIAEFAQDTDHLLIVDTKGIAVFTISSGKAVLVSTAATIDSVISLGWSTGRRSALLAYRDVKDNYQWLEVDTVAATPRPLSGLAGYLTATSGVAAQVQLFALSGSGATPAGFKVLDLASGSVRSLSGMDPRAAFVAGTARINGTWIIASTMISASSESLMQEWIINGSTGQAAWVEEGLSVRGAISPDGKSVVASRYDGSTANVDIVDLATGQKSSLGVGYDGVWLAP
jgi:hypothetical protein